MKEKQREINSSQNYYFSYLDIGKFYYITASKNPVGLKLITNARFGLRSFVVPVSTAILYAALNVILTTGHLISIS